MAIRRFPTEAASQASGKRVTITWTGSCSTVILEVQAHFLQCLRPPRSDSGPASPGSFKLTSDRYRGMGEAEREPSTSERDTEKPEVERRAREPDGNARRRPEIPEVNRQRRSPLPEVVEEYRRRPSVIQSVCSSSWSRFHSRTPRPVGSWVGARPIGNQ